MTAKEQLRERVEILTEAEAADALDYLTRRRHAVTEFLDNAPLEDELITEEEEEAVQEAREEIARPARPQTPRPADPTASCGRDRRSARRPAQGYAASQIRK